MSLLTRLRAFASPPKKAETGPNWSLVFRGRPGSALSYAPLLRGVSMLSKDGARLFCRTLAPVDREGYLLDSRWHRDRVQMLRRSWDGGITPAYQTAKRVFADLLLGGNAYLVPQWRGEVLAGMLRLAPETVRFEDYSGGGDPGAGAYVGREEVGMSVETRYPPRAIVHATYTPQGEGGSGSGMFRSGGTHQRIAPSPVEQISRIIASALLIEGRIERHFLHDARAWLGIAPRSEQGIDETQLKVMAESVRASILSGRPLTMTENVALTPIPDAAVGPAAEALQARLLRSVATTYGIPPQMLGEGTSAVKVEAMLREYWKGLGQLLDDLLEPLSQRVLFGETHYQVDQSHLIRGDYATASAVIRAAYPNTGAPRLGSLHEARRLLPFGPITREREAELEEAIAAPEPPTAAPPPETPA